MYNKIEDNFHVNNKKALFLNMKNYYEAMDADVFENIPLTFHIKTGLDDPEFHRFKHYYFKYEEDMKNKKAAAKQGKAREDSLNRLEQDMEEVRRKEKRFQETSDNNVEELEDLKKGAKKKLIDARKDRKKLCSDMGRRCQQVLEVLAPGEE